MEVPIVTLNTADAVAGSSTAADKPVFDPDSIGLVNTVIDATDAPATNTDGVITTDVDTSDKTIKPDSTDADKGDPEPDATKDADKGDDTRFDKHPRWQEMIRERDEARRIAEDARIAQIRLEAERDTLRQFTQKVEPVKPAVLHYRDITALTPDEITEWQVNDPKGYAANLYQQVLYEAEQRLNTVQAEREKQAQAKVQETKIKDTYAAYEKSNPDFKPMWDNGTIQKFMDDNPGHNPISAHQLMTVEKRIREATEKAAKEAEEKTNKNWQAKRQAKVIGSGPAAAPATGEDAELQNTKDKGGPVAVLAERLRRMRTG
jgi:hypothetical protein